MIIGTWGSNKNFWGGGRISALTNGTHLKKDISFDRKLHVLWEVTYQYFFTTSAL